MSINFVDTRDFGPLVAIVGGGASGTLLAAQLLRAGGTRVVLIERGARLGRGVAYGTRFAGHLLNVPAASMSGLPDDPDHFLRFLRERYDPAIQPTTNRFTLGADAIVDVYDDSAALSVRLTGRGSLHARGSKLNRTSHAAQDKC